MAGLATGALVALLAGILAIAIEGYRRGDYATVANALVSFAVALLPPGIAALAPTLVGTRVTVGVVLPLWLAVAGLVHSYGMLGPYDSIWWWDTLTHTVSAALVAALVYAGLLVAVPAIGLDVSRTAVAVLTVAFTLAAGVFWELIELLARDVGRRFDVEPVLVHYGWRDTAIDLVVDVAGATIVVLLNLTVFLPVAEQAPGATTWLVLGTGAVVVVGSVMSAVAVVAGRRGQG